MHGSPRSARPPVTPRTLSRLAGFCLGSLIASGLAAPLTQEGLVFVVRNGSSSSGQPLFTIADSSDPAVRRIWDRVSSDPEVRRATESYSKIQQDRRSAIRAELASDGEFSAQDAQVLAGLPGPHPVYVEIKPGTGGAFNDWKSVFSLRSPDGSTSTVAAPRIVFQANDPVIESSDRELFPHTLVHEIAHGFHAQLVGPGNTPSTPWLSRPHSGNTTSDGTLALIEGYAEFVAAYLTDRNTIANDPENALARNLYAYEPSGALKSAESLWATEGWAATVMLELAQASRIQNGFEKINSTIAATNPTSFRSMVERLQERYPGDRQAIRSVIAKASHDRVYPGEAQGEGEPTERDPGDWTYDETSGRTDSRDFNTGRIAATVIGGVLGAVFGVSFGPVGIVLAGAAGAGIGALIGKMFFGDDKENRGSFDFGLGGWNPLSPGGSVEIQEGLPAAPGGSPPDVAAAGLADAYRRYRRQLSRTGPSSGLALEEARREYHEALGRYRSALSADR